MLTHTETLAPDVLRFPVAFVNAYAVGEPGGPWVLIDTGLPGGAAYLQPALEQTMGGAPAAIVLTHGHFDHAGSALVLAEAWDVPIYAHKAELPFLNGRSDYPPADPSMGGAIAQLARAFPAAGYDFGDRVRALPQDGTLPELEGWEVIHTPGHTPGHVSFWRRADQILLAGDALATMDLDSWLTQVTHERELARSPVPFTPDWDAAEESVRTLASLNPRVLGAGHGRVMNGPKLAERLREYAATPQRPTYGRYAETPATFDEERGVVSLPPEVADKSLIWLVAGVVFGIGVAVLLGQRHRD